MAINERYVELKEEPYRNINKYHRFLHVEIQKYEGNKETKDSLAGVVAGKIQTRGYCALKKNTLKRVDLPVLTQSFVKVWIFRKVSFRSIKG